MTIKKIEHVGIKVKNIETSISFYKDLLGMELFEILKPNDTVTLAFLGFQSQNVVIELIEGSDSDLANEGKVSHLAFTVDNIEVEVQRLKNLNIALKSYEISTLPNGSRFIFFEGPDKESLELFEPSH
jgi:lactoylglutathione lyase